jgi:hypothetical protein
MADEFPDYEPLGRFYPVDAPGDDGFFQTPMWLHRPCGIVVADMQAHDGWCGRERQRIRNDQRRAGVPAREQVR